MDKSSPGNLALFKKRFAEAKDEVGRQIVAKLLAEGAKDLPPKLAV